MAKHTKRFMALPPERTNERGDRICRWPTCTNILPRRRKDWCSKKCWQEYLIRSNTTAMRTATFHRDKGVCALCNLDTTVLERELLEFRKTYDANPASRPALYEGAKKFLERFGDEFAARLYIDEKTGGRMKWRSLWESDHVLAVAEGGRDSGLDNLRTLCRKCHLKVTHEMHVRLGR